MEDLHEATPLLEQTHSSIESLADSLDSDEEELQEISLIKHLKMTEAASVHSKFHNVPKEEQTKFVRVTEIFFDLLFVAAVGRYNDALREGAIGWDTYFPYFFVTFMAWKRYTFHDSVFAQDDMLDKGYTFVYGIGVIGLSIWGASSPDTSNGIYFGCSNIYLLGLRLIGGVQVLRDLFHASSNHKLAHRERAVRWSYLANYFWSVLVMVCWLVFTLSSPEKRTNLIWVPLSVEIAGDFILSLVFKRRNQIHPHTHHFNERYEAIILITLGEAAIGISMQAPWGDNFLTQFGYIVFGFSLMYLMKMFHFDVEEYILDCPDNHALRHGGIWFVLWMYTNIIEACGIALFGGAIAEITKYQLTDFNDGDGFLGIRMFCVGLTIELASNLANRFTHTTRVSDHELGKCIRYFQNITQLCYVFAAIIPTIIWPERIDICYGFGVVILFSLVVLFLLDEIFQVHFIRLKIKKEKAMLKGREKDKNAEVKDLETSSTNQKAPASISNYNTSY